VTRREEIARALMMALPGRTFREDDRLDEDFLAQADAVLARINEAEARANTAKVAAELHLARIRELEVALKAAIPFVEWAQFCGTMIDCRAKADEARALARAALGRGE